MSIFLVGLSLAAAACDRKAGPARDASATPPARAQAEASSGAASDATINEIMRLQVEPAADVIWGSVKTVSDATGVHDFRPTTPAQWAAVGDAARDLLQAARSLREANRRLVRPGSEMEEGGTLSPEAIQAKIDAQRPKFRDKAQGLEAAALKILTDVEARDAEKLLYDGGPLDDACEACHTEFYYPPAPAN